MKLNSPKSFFLVWDTAKVVLYNSKLRMFVVISM